MHRRSGMTRPAGRSGLLALAATVLLVVPTAAQDASPSVAPDGSAAPVAPRPLEPGRHSWSDLGVELSLEVDAGWTMAPPLDGPLIVLEREDMPGGVLSLTRFDGDAFADPCDPTSLTWVEPSAQRLIEIIGWLIVTTAAAAIVVQVVTGSTSIAGIALALFVAVAGVAAVGVGRTVERSRAR